MPAISKLFSFQVKFWFYFGFNKYDRQLACKQLCVFEIETVYR
jgi:hypothetical protein